MTAKCRHINHLKTNMTAICRHIHPDIDRDGRNVAHFSICKHDGIPEMEASLKATTDKAADLQRFIERTRQVTRLTELTPEIVHEFIEKIVVSKPEKVDGKRHQTVDIYYNTIGLWAAPEPKMLEQEYVAHYQAMQKRKKKTA